MIEEKAVMEAFKIFAVLNANGQVLKEDAKEYMDDIVRNMLMEFVNEVDCTIVTAGDYLYLVPLTVHSIYHVNNNDIKYKHMPNRALNMDIYLMYVAVIIFIGEFYDSYQSNEPTREFLTISSWLNSVNERIETMKQIDEQTLEELEKEYEYNWLGIIKRWDSLDIIKETVKKQTAKTASRISFMNVTKEFMIKENLAVEVGYDELALSEKAKVIVQRYFMDYEYNRGILEIIYNYVDSEEEIDAIKSVEE